MDSSAKEWVRVARAANTGATTVTVTLQDGQVTVKWSVRAHGNLKAGLTEARKYAREALAEMLELVDDEG